VHYAFRYFVWQMDVLGCIYVDVKGREQLRQTRGQLVIANHPSLIDVVILIACIPSCDCIVKQALWRNPFIGGVVRWSGYISNSSPEDLLAQCRQSFDNGSSIIVFPEGTRTVDDKALKFQRGAANIALRCGVEILPVKIVADPPTLKKGEPWYRVPPRSARFTVTVQAPIAVDSVISSEIEPAKATRQLNRYLQHYYQGLLDHA
jgi:1-acyl-sn-glycerol-3-phosphate acyltransferase